MRSWLWHLFGALMYCIGLALSAQAWIPECSPDLPVFAARKPGQCPRPPECPDCAPATAYAK